MLIDMGIVDMTEIPHVPGTLQVVFTLVHAGINPGKQAELATPLFDCSELAPMFRCGQKLQGIDLGVDLEDENITIADPRFFWGFECTEGQPLREFLP